jgi:hypothetical protein
MPNPAVNQTAEKPRFSVPSALARSGGRFSLR